MSSKPAHQHSPLVRLVIAGGVFEEEKARRLADIDAAVAEQDSGGQAQSFRERIRRADNAFASEAQWL